MPPWHIDRTVGSRKSRTIDRRPTRSSTRPFAGSTRALRRATNDLLPPKEFARDDVGNLTESVRRPARPGHQVDAYTMPALAQDHWWKPEVSDGLAEDRVDPRHRDRPSTVPGRKITYHALARLQQEETDPLGRRAAPDVGSRAADGMGGRKQGEIMRPNSASYKAARHRLGHPLLRGRRSDHTTPWSSASTSTPRDRSRSSARRRRVSAGSRR